MPGLSEALIRQHATSESFRRGRDYYYEGAVGSLVRRGNVLQAEVEGSQPEAYRVDIEFDDGGVLDADCDCPYSYGGWCKHIVAVLLACLNDAEEIEERPPLDKLLADLSRENLRDLILSLAERQPSLVDAIEVALRRLQVKQTESADEGAEAAVRRTAVDLDSIRAQVRASLHSLDRMRSSEAYWHVGAVVDEVRGVLEKAWAFIRAGDGRTALGILDAITDVYVAEWHNLDGSNGETCDFFESLGEAWTEAVLSAELTLEERKYWARKLGDWWNEMEDYGVDEAFDAALEATRQGWDDPSLQRVLRGEQTAEGPWDGEAPEWSTALTVARLNVLDRQGRHEEYLRLAEAEGQMERYVLMLVRRGRAQEATECGLRHMTGPWQALTLAKALREHGDIEAALRVAEHGLDLEGARSTLAVWLGDLAVGMGLTERALSAFRVAFRENPDLVGYSRLRELAGESWPELRAELLDELRRCKTYVRQGVVDVFLHEGLVDDAIATVEGAYDDDVVEQVVDAAIESHPDWVIKTCRRRAEYIMDEGKAQRYQRAAEWLKKVKSAYLVAGRGAEWRPYLEDLISTHRRKYTLRPLLEGLRH